VQKKIALMCKYFNLQSRFVAELEARDEVELDFYSWKEGLTRNSKVAEDDKWLGSIPILPSLGGVRWMEVVTLNWFDIVRAILVVCPQCSLLAACEPTNTLL
jgi:hypothetical protein